MSRPSRRLLATSCALALLAAAAPAWAGTAVNYWREGGLMTTVVDDGPGDLDLDPLEIRVDFALSNPGFWSATGTIIAIGGGLVPVETIVTDLLIQNVGGPVINEAFFVEHEFTTSLTATPFTAELDGEYDKLQPALNIGIADLLYIPRVNDEDIGAIDPPAAANQPPTVAFAGASGPLYPSETPLTHTLELRFYLDELGDAIRLPNSASISQVVPEPGPGALLWLSLGAVAAGLRRRAAS
jgi:hypothetical protein